MRDVAYSEKTSDDFEIGLHSRLQQVAWSGVVRQGMRILVYYWEAKPRENVRGL